MKHIDIKFACGFGIVVIALLTFFWHQYQHNQESVIPTAIATSTQHSAINDEDAVDLAKISPNCAKYYEDLAGDNNPIVKELADFNNLHPLSDFLCGSYSMIQPKAKLPDGKILHFVAPVFSVDCGASGHCTYYPLLEEKPGLVRHIRGFTWYDDTGSTQDTDGTIFAWEITYNPSNNTLLIDDTHLGGCGTENTYKFNTADDPILILATDYDCLRNSTTTLFKL